MGHRTNGGAETTAWNHWAKHPCPPGESEREEGVSTQLSSSFCRQASPITEGFVCICVSVCMFLSVCLYVSVRLSVRLSVCVCVCVLISHSLTYQPLWIKDFNSVKMLKVCWGHTQSMYQTVYTWVVESVSGSR